MSRQNSALFPSAILSRHSDELDTAPFRLREDFVHYRKRATHAGPDNEPLAAPRNFFPRRKRCVAELFAELLGTFFLSFPHIAAVNHHIMRIARSLYFDFTKFDRSCLHISMFGWRKLQRNYPCDSHLR